MKHILTLTLILSITLTPSIALAVDEILPTSAARPGSGSTQDVLSDTGPNSASKIAALAQAGQADVIGCKTGGKGGALASHFSSFVQNMIPQLLRSKLQPVVNKLASKAGPLGGFIQQAANIGIDKLSGYLQKLAAPYLSQLDQSLGGLLNGPLGGALSSILGGGSLDGVAQQALGQLIQNPTSFATAVPVNTVSINAPVGKIDKQTKATQDATETSAQVTCVGNVAVRQVAKAMRASIAESAAEALRDCGDGKPCQITNYGELIGEGVEAVTKNVIDNQLNGVCAPYKLDVKSLLLVDSNIAGNPVQCAVQNGGGPETGNPDSMWSAGWTLNSSPLDQLQQAYEYKNQQVNAYVQNEKLRLLSSSGDFRPKGRCSSGVTPKANTCPDGSVFIVDTPGSVLEDQAKKLVDTSRVEAEQADEIGELPNQLIAALTSYVLQGAGGLLQLAQKSGSKGSYLGDAVAESTYTSNTSVQDAVGGDIVAALDIEKDYRDTLSSALQAVVSVKNGYASVVACAKPKAETGNAVALQKMNNASSTISIILDPQIRTLTQSLNESSDAVDQLTQILRSITGALTTEEVVAANQDYQALVDADAVHSALDLANLTSSLQTAGTMINLLAADAVQQLAECQAL